MVSCKNKTRTILLPRKLQKELLQYAKQCGISSGIIFRTKSGKALDRSNIWSEMKNLCQVAQVNPSKVFPHNLRKLFARTFYKLEKDIAKDVQDGIDTQASKRLTLNAFWEDYFAQK